MNCFYRLLSVLMVPLLMMACGERNEPTPQPEPTPDIPAQEDSVTVDVLKSLDQMTLREKVGQMFNIRPERIMPQGASKTDLSVRMKQAYEQYPVGGFTLFAQNILGPKQLIEFTTTLHALPNYPMLCIDEEGGRVARIANHNSFSVPTYVSMYDIGSTGNTDMALEVGTSIGSYLRKYGLDVNFAPVADVWTNPLNTVIGNRSFSSNPQVVTAMTAAFYQGLQSQHIVGCYKHFPGHGDTSTDTHYGYAEVTKSWDQLLSCELLPFQNAINNGVEMIMAAHISCPTITGDATPATLSHLLLTDKLRGEMGFRGLIITDGMEMGAIVNQYPNGGDAAIAAIQAGVDIILLPADFQATFDAVLHAVEQGIIPESRIDESVSRILALKQKMLQENE